MEKALSVIGVVAAIITLFLSEPIDVAIFWSLVLFCVFLVVWLLVKERDARKLKKEIEKHKSQFEELSTRHEYLNFKFIRLRDLCDKYEHYFIDAGVKIEAQYDAFNKPRLHELRQVYLFARAIIIKGRDEDA